MALGCCSHFMIASFKIWLSSASCLSKELLLYSSSTFLGVILFDRNFLIFPSCIHCTKLTEIHDDSFAYLCVLLKCLELLVRYCHDVAETVYFL